MRRLLLILLLLASPAWADPHGQEQVAQLLPMPGMAAKPTIAAGYTGPGDIATFLGWWGFRAFSAAKRGTNAVNLCNGGVCADVSTDATTGKLPNAPTINGAACDNSTHVCTIHTIYDQASTRDLVQATAANQPTWLVSALSSMACDQDNANTFIMSSSASLTQAQPFSYSMVYEVPSGTRGTAINIISDITPHTTVFFDNGAFNAIGVWAGGSLARFTTFADGAFHAAQITVNGASTHVDVDGTTSGNLNPGTNGYSAAVATGSNNTSAFVMCEMGIMSGSVSSGNITSLNSNQHTFWGF